MDAVSPLRRGEHRENLVFSPRRLRLSGENHGEGKTASGGRGLETVLADDLGVPLAAVLDRAPQGLVIHVDQPEARSIAPIPLEVVEHRSDEVAFDGHAVIHGAPDLHQVVAQIADAPFSSFATRPR